MIAVVLFLLIVLGVAATRQVSPKAVLQGRFTRDTVVVPANNIVVEETGGNMIPIETSDTEISTGLSDQEKDDTTNFLNSMGQTQ